ncbi:MAG: DNA double-strand break repair nuclease NurA [Armatimonadota bacterium]|nr:DNA double-strand break repair nuclease NurA [Armatimonadota bacterium]
MSVLSEILKGYRDSLAFSRNRFEQLYRDRLENGCQFYHQFFHRLILPFAERFRSENYRRRLREAAERILDTDRIDFVAIDGTCYKDAFQDFVVFFGGAYGAKGSVRLKSDPPVVQYERWDMNRDVSLVAYVPVPFATIEDVTSADVQETFVVSDQERVNLSNIHTSLMQLAEIYLAYSVASASTHDYPRLIMLDQSLSGLMAAVSHGAGTELVGYPHDRRELDSFDVRVAFMHPVSRELGVPTTKRFGRHLAVLAEFHHRNTQSIPLDDLRQSLRLSSDDLLSAVRILTDKPVPLCELDVEGNLRTRYACRDSWRYTLSLFESICERLFVQKDPSALVYETPDPDRPGLRRQRWMSPEDVHFLTTVGLRALIEQCWERNILLVGVVKDSESRYLTRNYMGVMKQLGVYPELQEIEVAPLPWTDRIFLETVPLYCDTSLEAPWSTIEFDSVFQTLRLGIDEFTQEPTIIGTPSRIGEIVSPERLFLRSLAQFFLSRDKRTPISGHVIFLDRLAVPRWDKGAMEHDVIVRNERVGTIKPLLYPDAEADNAVQQVMMYLLDVLTRNHFPEVIGYPDPLHKADQGAKTVGKRAREMILSSEIPFHSNPIARTLRHLREEGERHRREPS